jgi:hypothetical protein
MTLLCPDLRDTAIIKNGTLFDYRPNGIGDPVWHDFMRDYLHVTGVSATVPKAQLFYTQTTIDGAGYDREIPRMFEVPAFGSFLTFVAIPGMSFPTAPTYLWAVPASTTYQKVYLDTAAPPTWNIKQWQTDRYEMRMNR